MIIKITLYRSIVVCDPETWALRKAEELKLTVFERKVLRKMYGLIFYSQMEKIE